MNFFQKGGRPVYSRLSWWITVLFYWLVGASAAHADESISYVLEQNEYLIVAGKEYREFKCEYSQKGDSILINGCVVAARAAPSGRPFSETLIAEGADWTRYPYVSDKVASGVDVESAAALYKQKIDEFYEVVRESRTDTDDDLWLKSVDRWMADPLNQGVIEFVEMRPLGLTFLLRGDNGPVVVRRHAATMGAAEERTIASFGGALVAFFRDGTEDQLAIVCEGGGMGYFGGRSVAEMRSQVLEMSKLRRYVDGPLKEPLAVGFGLVEED